MLTEALRRARRALMRSFSSAVRAASETAGGGPLADFLGTVRRWDWTRIVWNSLVVRRAIGRGGVCGADDFTFMPGFLVCTLTLRGGEVLLEGGPDTCECARYNDACGLAGLVKGREIRTMAVAGRLEEVSAVLLQLQAGVALQICVVVHGERGLGSDGGYVEREGRDGEGKRWVAAGLGTGKSYQGAGGAREHMLGDHVGTVDHLGRQRTFARVSR